VVANYEGECGQLGNLKFSTHARLYTVSLLIVLPKFLFHILQKKLKIFALFVCIFIAYLKYIFKIKQQIWTFVCQNNFLKYCIYEHREGGSR